ncbi:MAG: mandelate racemase/muconate lactonizing enzyme family protein [Chloroflexota bacterium]
MRVTDVKTFLVSPISHHAGMIGGKNWLFAKIETDAGIVGWGEGYTQLDRDRNIVQMAQELARYLVGQDPFRIKNFTHMVYDDYSGRRGSMDLYCALSALEQGLWDVVGKALGVPVYTLLGGPCRDRVRVYANGWYGGAKTPEDHARLAEATVARGFTALKFDPFPGPWRLYVDHRIEEAAVANVRAVREAVGPSVEILIEGHRRLSPMNAIRVGQAFEAYRPFWFEEPVPAENVAALAEVRRKLNIPIVTGETLYTKADFRDVFEQHAADIINPDVCNCGGILELKEIAAMAEPYYVAVSPHNYNSTSMGLAATVQAAACMPNFLITEYFVNFEQTSAEIVREPLTVQDGYIALPERPGLGVELVEEELLRRPYEQRPPRAMPPWR